MYTIVYTRILTSTYVFRYMYTTSREHKLKLPEPYQHLSHCDNVNPCSGVSVLHICIVYNIRYVRYTMYVMYDIQYTTYIVRYVIPESSAIEIILNK